MKTAQDMTIDIMNGMESNLEEIGHELNVVIDSMTDENCEPLPLLNEKLVRELQEIALKLYKQTQQIEWDKRDIVFNGK